MKKNDVTDLNKDCVIMPLIAVRGIVAFPGQVLHFDVVREISLKAIRASLEEDRKIFLVTQREATIDDPDINDIYKYGTICEIRQLLKTGDGFTRVLVEGLRKAKINKMYTDLPYLDAEVCPVDNYSRVKFDVNELSAIVRAVRGVFEQYAMLVPQLPGDVAKSVMTSENPEKIFEEISFNINISFEEKQKLLELPDILSKLTYLFTVLTSEVQIMSLERNIHEQVRANLDKNQRDFYLREQQRVLAEQLGEDDNFQDEAFGYYEKIIALKLPDEHTEKLLRETDRLSKMSSGSQEAFVVRNYLDTCLELPWNKLSKEKTDIARAAAVLDKEHYGMKKVKERILESIAVHSLLPDTTGQIICLVGPPGVGKTSIGKSVAKALGRKYVRISLGGVRDEAEIRGHRKTYVGSMPGRIITAMKQAGTANPLILLDEIDKMSSDFKGDPSSAMLEVLDSEQNSHFVDHYIELPFDLSRVMFITTANDASAIPAPLLDRMEVIELPSYTSDEKFQIGKRHLISKQLKKNGLRASQMRINDDALKMIIDGYTRESGVRTLERTIASLCRKAAKEIVSGETKRLMYNKSNLEKYLGAIKYLPDDKLEKNDIGIVNGLAWTSVGGVLMTLETLVLDGKGGIEITGYLGNVMKESARLAVSYCRSVAEKYGIDPKFYRCTDIHIHATEGAVPKDGPSAGVTMVTAMISALSGIPVRGDVAMTGEITLHGKVLSIGGLREKAMAAYRNNIPIVIAPIENKRDLEEIDEVVRESIDFRFVRTLDEVLDIALDRETEPAPKSYNIMESYDTCSSEQNVVRV